MAGKTPTHRAFIVEGPDNKPFWTDIGAGWLHEDGQGMNIRLKALPLGGEIVMRPIKAKSDDAPDAGAAPESRGRSSSSGRGVGRR